MSTIQSNAKIWDLVNGWVFVGQHYLHVVYVVEPLRLERHSVLPLEPSHTVYVVEPEVDVRQRVPAVAEAVVTTSASSSVRAVFISRSPASARMSPASR